MVETKAMDNKYSRRSKSNLDLQQELARYNDDESTTVVKSGIVSIPIPNVTNQVPISMSLKPNVTGLIGTKK